MLSRIFSEAGRSLVVITPGEKEAEDMAGDLAFFLESPPDIHQFPSYGLPPYHEAEPPREVIHQRLSCLLALASSSRRSLVVLSIDSLLQRTIPCDVFLSSVLSVARGKRADLDALARTLSEGGYARVGTVESPGEFSVRGGIVDIFPPSLSRPVRLELSGDKIASLRSFDPATQKSVGDVEEALIPPSREVIVNDEILARVEEELKHISDEHDLPRGRREEVYEELQSDVVARENFLPLFYREPGSIADYISDSTLMVLDDPDRIDARVRDLRQAAGERYRKAISEGPVPSPDSLRMSREELGQIIDKRQRLLLEPIRDVPAPDVSVQVTLPVIRGTGAPSRTEALLERFSSEVRDWLDMGVRVFFVSHDPVRFRRLFEGHHLHMVPAAQSPRPSFFRGDTEGRFTGRPVIIKGSLSSGFVIPSEGLAVVSEEDIFGPKRRTSSPPVSARPFLSYANLKAGDYVVHTLYGIGLYKGLQHLSSGGVDGDYLLLEYSKGDRLYLPVHGLRVLQKYHSGGDGPAPSLDRLGTVSWEKRKKKVEESLREMAEELLKIYAMKKALPGHSFSAPEAQFEEFEETFMFEETPDQGKAIEDVLSDMMKPAAMDRLVCGDVGFGKTEVALRAAFKAALDLKQVGVLVPTTLLAHQHFRNFTERLRPYPVVVEMLSRFVPRSRQKEILVRLRQGTVDIVIGTHRLLQEDVVFKDLGLLIIDEEHRFGVADKERLRRLRASVDVLSLTATPIPRTLEMSLSGLRDMSIISTPPPARREIQTYIAPFREDIIREAVDRELGRGGQVFFVHNRVKTLPAMAERLRELFPLASIASAHGRMPGETLEEIMVKFLDRKIDILVCTAIIESGLDIPSANTMIIVRADTFGLAELYQLRGRVGRSQEQAYAYLLVPEGESLRGDAVKRLQALRDFAELGSGFRLALQDLEIRGAGNLLGPEQSGHIAAVGYDLYSDLLEEAVRDLKGETVEKEIETEVSFPYPAYLPEGYVSDTGERLILYKRLAMASSNEDLAGIEEELRDRFGAPPQEAVNLLYVLRLKLAAKPLKAVRLDVGRTRMTITFHDTTPLPPEALVGLAREKPKVYRLVPSSTLEIAVSGGSPNETFSKIFSVLKDLSVYGTLPIPT